MRRWLEKQPDGHVRLKFQNTPSGYWEMVLDVLKQRGLASPEINNLKASATIEFTGKGFSVFAHRDSESDQWLQSNSKDGDAFLKELELDLP